MAIGFRRELDFETEVLTFEGVAQELVNVQTKAANLVNGDINDLV